jgi:septum formation protein
MLEEEYKKKIILASASPRRSEILKKILKIDFEVVKPNSCKEVQLKNPYRTVIGNSIIKAENVYNSIKKDRSKGKKSGYTEQFLIAGFDTVVYLSRRCFGKPGSIKEAVEFLNILSGRVHIVVSGVCVLNSISGKYRFDTDATKVKFKKLTPEEIRGYMNRESVLDKAGAYNIFGLGSLLVEKINGCFYNVAGLPIAKFMNLLAVFGFKVIS